MKTAEKLIEEENSFKDEDGNDVYMKWQVNNLMIKFAKIHVKAAIKNCIESAPSGSSTDTVSYEDVVEALKDCYPESNIK